MAGEPRKLSSFTGDFGSLVAAVLPHLDLFVRPLALECKRSRMLFVCSVPDNTVGGICDRKGNVVMEKLCVELEQDLLTPKEFWWFVVGTGRFRRATVSGQLDNMRSAYLAVWLRNVDGAAQVKNIPLHTILL